MSANFAADEPFDTAALVPVEPAAAIAALADAQQVAGHYGTAVALYRLASSLDPADLVLRARFARALFCLEDWAAAWRAYQMRFQLGSDMPRVARRSPDGTVKDYPRWRGGPAPRRLLVLHEQGLGDTLHFCRFLPDVVATGAAVTLLVQAGLVPMMRRLSLPITVRGPEAEGSAMGIDAWVPMLDLPLVLDIPPSRYAPPAPYLKADPERAASWRERIGEHGLKIGVAWAGNPAAPSEPGRSAPLAAFGPLAAIPGVRLFNLQKDGDAQVAAVPFRDLFEDLGPGFDEGPEAFRDTAALIPSLNAVVTVDTALAHLAGGLGCAVHLLLKTPWADWRWLGRATDTVWYPGTRLYRQDRPGDWAAPMARIAAALAGRPAGDGGEAPALLCVPLAVGDLIDRISILEIKATRLKEESKLANVLRELGALTQVRRKLELDEAALADPEAELRAVNGRLWELEAEIRALGQDRDSLSGIAGVAMAICAANDRRAELKREISLLTGSLLVEEKSYKARP